MAGSCLMIEAILSFRDGLEYTNAKGAGQQCFVKFFKSFRAFDNLVGHEGAFYSNIRCGILHQAETYGNWLISRKTADPLFDPARKTLNADKFFQSVVDAFTGYCDELTASKCTDAVWTNAMTKVRSICDHCRTGLR
jgi:hypothetical protein